MMHYCVCGVGPLSSPWLAYLFLIYQLSVCKIWDHAQAYQGTHIKTTHESFLTQIVLAFSEKQLEEEEKS